MASMPSPARAAAAPAFPSAPDNDEWPARSSAPRVSSRVQAVSLQNLDDDQHLNWRMPGASSRFALGGLVQTFRCREPHLAQVAVEPDGILPCWTTGAICVSLLPQL